MRAKKITSFLLAFVMLCTISALTVFAEEPADIPTVDTRTANETLAGQEEIISLTPECYTITDSNGKEVSRLRDGETYSITINKVYVGSGTIELNKVSFAWFDNNDYENPIQGETSSSHTFTYQKDAVRCCIVSAEINGEEKSCLYGFALEEDTSILVSGTVTGDVLGLPGYSVTTEESENPYDAYNMELQNVPRGSTGTLTVNAVSTQGKDKIKYKWTHEILDYEGFHEEVIKEETGEDGKTLEFTKNYAGAEMYHCTVTDGTLNEYNAMEELRVVTFTINPPDTLNIGTKVKINGVELETLGDIGYNGIGFKYGTKTGKELKIEVNAETTNTVGSPITYTWTGMKRKTETGEDEFEQVVVSNSNTLSITKADKYHSTYYEPDDDDSVSGVEEYECWISDGNISKRVLFCFYLVDNISTTNTTENLLSASITNDITEDLDKFLKPTAEAHTAMQNGSFLSQIKLDTEEKKETDIAAEVKAKIADTLSSKNDKVGMYLDINLHARMVEDISGSNGKDIPITETGTPVAITVNIPQNMLDAQGNVKEGQYQVVRVHNDKIETLACKKDTANKTITFDTDKFSLYALAYAESGAGTGAGNTGVQTGVASGEQKNPSVESSAPRTGDVSNAGRYAVLCFLAMAVMAGTLKRRKAV